MGPSLTGFLIADNVSLAGSQKTIADNIYSTLSGMDCSIVSAIDGDYYCRRHLPDNRVIDTKLYCYRTIGVVDCYTEPQPALRSTLVAPPGHKVGSRSEEMPF
ncbi:hypothetical protein IHV25_00640 [Phaeovibrio sulfidiphilus]|uniref:Uncharacterized protein n=1 Tax=Phaeovibrio sulfidiphilus TaxID=1220600 RepID=A0A8J7CPW5_9PROT|nr:hypothetical protein [Phaeovibrio sulfidiphilus]